MTSGKFSLQWVNNGDFTRPMSTARFNLRDSLSPHGESGLSCTRLHLDQVHIQFRPSKKADGTANIQDTELRSGDSRNYDWTNETLQLYVRLTPGERYVLYTSGVPIQETDPTIISSAPRSLVYSTVLSAGYSTAADTQDAYCRTYRPVRDLPVLRDTTQLTELQVDLLWPLLQGDPEHTVWWSVPDYRILRVICEFSYEV